MGRNRSNWAAGIETKEQAPEPGVTAPEDAETKLAQPAHEEGKSKERDLAVEAYALFCKGESAGEFPAWDALDTPTQKLWRDAHAHVAGGGKPRTDYEYAVKYLILSAQ